MPPPPIAPSKSFSAPPTGATPPPSGPPVVPTSSAAPPSGPPAVPRKSFSGAPTGPPTTPSKSTAAPPSGPPSGPPVTPSKSTAVPPTGGATPPSGPAAAPRGPPVVPRKSFSGTPTGTPTNPPLTPSKSFAAPPLTPSKSFAAPPSGPPAAPKSSAAPPSGGPQAAPSKTPAGPPSGEHPASPTAGKRPPAKSQSKSSVPSITVSVVLEGGAAVELVGSTGDSAFNSAALADEIKEMFGEVLKPTSISLILGEVSAICADISGEIDLAEGDNRRHAVEALVAFLRRPSPFSISLGRIASRGRAKPIKEVKMSCKAAFVNDVRVAPLPPGSLGGQPPQPHESPKGFSLEPIERPRSQSPHFQKGVRDRQPEPRATYEPSYSQRQQSPRQYQPAQRSVYHQPEPRYDQQDSRYEIDRQHMIVDRRPTPTRNFSSSFNRTEYRHGNPVVQQQQQGGGGFGGGQQQQQQRPHQYIQEQRQDYHMSHQSDNAHFHGHPSMGGPQGGDPDYHNQCVNKYFLRRQRSLDAPHMDMGYGPNGGYRN